MSYRIQDAVYNPDDQLHILVIPEDVQTVVIKEEAPEEWSPGLDQQDSEALKIKEEQLWSSLEGEQLSVKEEAGATRCSFTEAPSKSEDDEDLFSRLHQQQMEDRELPSSSSADLNTHEEDYSSSETEVSEDDEDVTHSDSHLKLFTDSVSGTEGSDWKSRAPESGGHTVNKPLICSECGKKFVNNRSLQRHMSSHSGIQSSGIFLNKECLTVKENVDSHGEVQTIQKTFNCNDCGKIFTRKSNLNTHMRSHSGHKPFCCDICERRFSDNRNLNTHMRIHTGQKPFVCDVCGQRFSQKPHLSTHMRIHTGQRPFGCDVCERRFSDKRNLNSHMKLHTGQKPFDCDVCGQKFSQKTTLNSHIRIHTGQRPFGCAVCERRFSRKTHLNRHMRIHTGNKKIICSDS